MELKSSIFSSVSTSPFQPNHTPPNLNSPRCCIKIGVQQIGDLEKKIQLELSILKQKVKEATPPNLQSPALRPRKVVSATDAAEMLFLLKNNCKTQHDVNQIHARLITTGIIKDASFTTEIIRRLAASPYLPLTEFARQVFFSDYASTARVNRDDPFLWNAVIKSYSHGDDPRPAVILFCSMVETGVLPDKFSFSLVLKACSRRGMAREGKQIHGLLSKFEVVSDSDLYLLNNLIWMYRQCGECESACKVFDRMPSKDSVSYNSMIDGYVKLGMIDLARKLFDEMPIAMKNLITWNSMLSGCVQLEDGLNVAWKLFDEMPERDLVSWNTMIDACVKQGKIKEAENLFGMMPKRDVITWASMIDGYAKTGNIEIARDLFDEMPHRDVVAWNAIMSGYVQNGLHYDALDIFHSMQIGPDFSPDKTTLLIVLSAAAQLGNLAEGISVHNYIVEKGFYMRGNLTVALVDMYAKCGSIEKALSVFEGLEEKTVVHWNAMISGLAVHGLGDMAFRLFIQMERASVLPNEITFIGLLTACGHAGLVKEGLIGFELMRRVYKLKPRMKHYGCMVSILGRAGYLEETIKFIEGMPIKPNEVIWTTLLAVCKIHENFEIGKEVAHHLISLDSNNSSFRVLLSHVYAGLRLWDRASRTRSEMKNREMKKPPGCSWIEVEGIVHEFSAQDCGHSRTEEIYSLLGSSRISN